VDSLGPCRVLVVDDDEIVMGVTREPPEAVRIRRRHAPPRVRKHCRCSSPTVIRSC